MPVDRQKGKSPYVRKQKAPYIYKFRGCDHRRTQKQSVSTTDTKGIAVSWVGKVCLNCNIIVV